MGAHMRRVCHATRDIVRESWTKGFEPVFEAGVGRFGVQVAESPVASEGDERGVAIVLVAPEVERPASS